MKLNPFKLLDPDYKQDDKDASKYDESVLQQGRFWMRTVTWTLIGTTVFGVAWLAIARTEEIVVAKGQLEPVGSVQDIQMPVGGVVDDILVEEGDSVKKGEILMKLDTEASEQQLQSLEASIKFKGVERNKSIEMSNAQIQMLQKISPYSWRFLIVTSSLRSLVLLLSFSFYRNATPLKRRVVV